MDKIFKLILINFMTLVLQRLRNPVSTKDTHVDILISNIEKYSKQI